MQADDFFNAYKLLRENNEVIFSQFQKSDKNLRTGTKASAAIPAIGPSVVCLAFAVELYIKDLHFVLKGKAPRGHNIFKLYEGLPEQTKQNIFAHDSISQNPFVARGVVFPRKAITNSYEGFLSQIQAISDGFEKWRYSYESSTLRYDEWFALAFIEAVKAAADNIRKRAVA